MGNFISDVEKIINKITFLEYRRRRRRKKRVKKSQNIAKEIISHHGPKVLSGPFSGLKYPFLTSAGSGLTPKLIGSYEEEAQEFVEQLINTKHKKNINIGCGEGYYVVGMAMRMPDAHVHAFDKDPKARALCKKLARANSVSNRITVNGLCNIEKLSELTDKPAIIICDCEGCEIDILDPNKIPGLIDCDMLVELHDTDNHTPEVIQTRFKDTHQINVKKFDGRDPTEYPQIDFLSSSNQKFAMDENRSTGLEWALLKAK